VCVLSIYIIIYREETFSITSIKKKAGPNPLQSQGKNIFRIYIYTTLSLRWIERYLCLDFRSAKCVIQPESHWQGPLEVVPTVKVTKKKYKSLNKAQ
jgi:hypothetical protein